MQWNKEYLQEITTKMNTAFNELYDSTNWPGFELARITKAYDPTHHGTADPGAALSQISAQPRCTGKLLKCSGFGCRSRFY